MHFLLAKFQRLGWNTKIFSPEDFYRLCRRERPRVRVHEIPLQVPGFLMVIKGVPHIYINDHLRGVAWLKVALHELGHYYLHTPPDAYSSSFYMVTPHTKEEHEAEAFALVAMIPEQLLRAALTWQIEEAYGFPREIIEARVRVLDLYGV